ncbi:T9SS type A sorting domain-containing protein [Halosquirtibacter xylanolyticus]|uniref:T9SS type A sorting domain-containing protein n=1 Tax=Halosquirtibacter xylanolyticus TaxID=3374599 RepID=UPI0037491C68|nr:T9SS type A sorting domain-containing protein [Prolixibacteraceae bacterium]
MQKCLSFKRFMLLMRASLFVIGYFIYPITSLAQSYSQSHPVNLTRLESHNDYEIVYKMELSSRFYECGNLKNQPLQAFNSNWYEVGPLENGWGERTVRVKVYPNGGISIGGKYKADYGHCATWSMKSIGMRTAPLKEPYNFALLFQKSNNTILVRWSNATDVPTDKYKIKIKRTDLNSGSTSTIELNGGTTSYTDSRDIRPSARYKYEVCTHFPGGYSQTNGTNGNTRFNSCPSSTSSWVSQEIVVEGMIDNFEVDTRRTSMSLKWDVNYTSNHNIIRLEYKPEGATSWSLVEELSATTDQYDWTPTFNMVPGNPYDLRIRAMNDLTEKQVLSSSGVINPNGVLSGHVKIAESEKGVPGVPVKIMTGIPNTVKYRKYTNIGSVSGDLVAKARTLDGLTPSSEGVITSFNSSIIGSSAQGAILESWLLIEEEGEYYFGFGYIDDAAVLKIDGVEVTVGTIYTGSPTKVIHLTAGFHHIQANYINKIGDKGLSVRYKAKGTASFIYLPGDNLYNLDVAKVVDTDKEGYFYVDEVYYNEETEFIISTDKKDSNISPITVTRTLSIEDNKQDDILFQDYSSLPVYGRVMVDGCPIEGAFVEFNGEKTDTQTKADGSFEYIIQAPNPSLKNTIGINYKNHQFDQVIDLDLAKDTNNDDNPFIFHDQQTDELTLSVLSGCENPIADEVDVQLLRADALGNICGEQTVTIDNSGTAVFNLPATYYKAKVVDLRITNSGATQLDLDNFNSVKQNIIDSFNEIDIDLTQRDTVKVQSVDVINEKTGETRVREEITDTLAVRADFRYRQEIVMTLESTAWDTPAGSHQVQFEGETFNEDIFTMEQGEEYNVKVKLNEKYDYYRIMAHQCGVEEAKLLVNDVISDKQQKEYTILDGTYNYTITAGNANINGPWDEPHGYQKNVSLTAIIKDYEDVISTEKWSLILGEKVLEPTFITNELALPEFILHDPPGDESYAFIQKGMSLTTGTVFKGANLNGIDSHNLFQFAIPTPVMNIGIGVQADIAHKEGFITENEDIYTTTFNESISTTNDLTGTGEDADVIIGSALNFVYSKSKRLGYDGVNEPTTENSFTVSPGFKTRYILSVYHVKTKVIPALDAMLENIAQLKEKVSQNLSITDQESKLITNEGIFTASKANWTKVISDNQRRIFVGGEALGENESSISNLTFSGGNNYDYSRDKSTSTTRNSAYHWEVETKVGALFTGVNPLMDLAKIEVNALYVNDSSKETNELNTKVENLTTGFHLGDSSAGDYFTINVTEDPKYKTYVFQTVSGTSSCPNEPFTQARDRIKMSALGDVALANLPEGKSAVYTVRLNNDSQSEEGRIYSINVLEGQDSGATIKVGGKKVFGLANTYSIDIPFGETKDVTVEVIPGPNTRSLDIKLVATPNCMTDVYKTEDLRASIMSELGKSTPDASSVELTASWESNCDPIYIESPADNWIVNSYVDNQIPITLTGFDPNSQEMSYIEIEYKKVGDNNWSSLKTYMGDAIGDFPRKHISVDVSTLDGGNYLLRAATYCNDLKIRNYSNVVPGVIDHNEFVIVGTNVDNGWLRDPLMEVTFTKELASAQFKVEKLSYDKSTVINTSYEDADIIQNRAYLTIPNADQYEGFSYRITAQSGNISDINGHLLTDDKSFDITLDRSLVRWKENSLVAIIIKNEQASLTPVLINNSSESASFKVIANSLSKYITPIISEGVVGANGNFPIQFDIDSNIPSGILTGIITVQIDENDKSYNKSIDLRLIVKSDRPEMVTAESKAYQMHIFSQFTPSNTANIPLSEDERDYVTAYIDGQVVGSSSLYYDTNANEYCSYITVESDVQNGGTITFQMWDDSEGIMYTAKETETFNDNSLLGSADTPIVLHADQAIQYIRLYSGWNFVSFNVTPSNLQLPYVLGDITQDGAQIKHINDGFSTYSADLDSWSGQVYTISPDKAYKIYVPNNDIIQVQGAINNESYALSTSSYDNTLFNWVAVHKVNSMSIEDAINKSPLLGGVVIRHEDDFSSLRTDKSSWRGSVTMIEPGKGYEIYDSNLLDETIAMTKSASITSEEVIQSNVRNTMTVVGQSYLNGKLLNSDDYIVDAIIDGKIIGRNFFDIKDELTSKYQFYMLKADDNQVSNVIFELTDQITGKTYLSEQTISYENDKVVGSLTNPLKIEFGQNNTAKGQVLSIYPNPVKQGDICNAHLNFDVEPSMILQISTMDGKIISQQQITSNRFVINTNDLNVGIYNITIMKSSQVIDKSKLIIH